MKLFQYVRLSVLQRVIARVYVWTPCFLCSLQRLHKLKVNEEASQHLEGFIYDVCCSLFKSHICTCFLILYDVVC